jgi:outer membrane protein assembly factor BamA
MLACGCASIPRRSAAVNSVGVDGTRAVDEADVKAKMATTPSPKFLGLFRGVVYEYEIFNQAVLATDLQRIERYYRARGFYKARVRAGRVFYVDDKHVRVQIEVEEGPPVIVRRLTLRGLQGLPAEIAKSATNSAHKALPLGDRFDEDVFLKAEEDLRHALTDEGYAHAKVTRLAEVDLPRDQASLAFDVEPGKRAQFGEVLIEGLGEVPEAPVRRALDIQPGTPYSTASIESAEQALLELGVFSQVRIDPVLDMSNENETVIPLRVSLKPSRLRSVQLGGGVQVDALHTDVHLLAGWEHKNFFGGLRRFSV